MFFPSFFFVRKTIWSELQKEKEVSACIVYTPLRRTGMAKMPQVKQGRKESRNRRWLS